MTKWIVAAMLLAGAAHARKAEKAMEWKGQYGGPADAGAEVASDAAAWRRLWLTLGQDAPALDLNKYSAVAVFAGEQPTGGYAVELLDPVRKGRDLIVRYRIKPPAGFTTQAIARPWKVRAVPRAKGKIIVEAAPEPGPR
jgi:hypothetical protein